MLSKHSINKKKYFLTCFTKRLRDFKNTIFENTIFNIALPNGPIGHLPQQMSA